MKGRILLVEDDKNFRTFLHTVLKDEGYEVATAGDGLTGLQLIQDEPFDLVISDLKMPGKSGFELFKEAMQEERPPLFIFMTAFGRVEEAVTAIKNGAFDFLTKPLKSPDALLEVVNRALESQPRRIDCLSPSETETAGLPPVSLIFAGQAMESVHTLVHNVAVTVANVLIYGESGTGKELVARVIHLLSPRGKGSFIPINCAAIPENLLESELFGHEKGAFTGAVQARKGKFELAEGGTIFLDEIGEMPLALQAKLLRVLQERVFERVGGSKEIKADVRVIAATNRDLGMEVAHKRFREDLFYRLNVFPIHLPPLRERYDCIPLLADYFLQRFSRQNNKQVKGIEQEALSSMNSYAWPGNIRELQNIMERAVILAQDTVRCTHLLVRGTPLTEPPQQPDVPEKMEAREMLKSMEREMIVKVLERHDGNRRLAAEELHISRRSLQYKLKEFGLLNEE
ncbi:MAG: sigma-54 dependent transcriptional regulator [Geobacteraceae bacterium]|nr:sigma-54 dependent transcriptional regulator [Geobacteraceae bacterium]